MRRRFLPRITAITLMVATSSVWTQAGDKKAAGTQSRLVSNMTAITQGQMAQVNIVNWGDDVVNVEAALIGRDGKPFLDTTTPIAPGQSFSAVFQWPCCGDGRVELRGSVSLIETTGKTSLDQLVANLEIFNDQTGATALILPYILLPAVRTAAAAE